MKKFNLPPSPFLLCPAMASSDPPSKKKGEENNHRPRREARIDGLTGFMLTFDMREAVHPLSRFDMHSVNKAAEEHAERYDVNNPWHNGMV